VSLCCHKSACSCMTCLSTQIAAHVWPAAQPPHTPMLSWPGTVLYAHTHTHTPCRLMHLCVTSQASNAFHVICVQHIYLLACRLPVITKWVPPYSSRTKSFTSNEVPVQHAKWAPTNLRTLTNDPVPTASCSQQDFDRVPMTPDYLMWKAHATVLAEFEMHSFQHFWWQQNLASCPGHSLLAYTMSITTCLFRSKLFLLINVNTVEAWT